jgi:RHS repeat-associated protein
MDNPVGRGGTAISYDGLGNVTGFVGALGQIQLTFSDDSRLQSATVGNVRHEYAYDGLCRRVLKTDGLAVWRFGWSGFQLLWEEYRVKPGAEPVRRDYLYLPGCIVPVAFRERGQTFWIQSDARGAVIAVHDQNGQIVWRGVYDSFGNVHAVVNRIRQPWRFAGQYFDDETGLHYNVARYYSPELKSYLSLDPRWQEDQASKYNYCRNDPWNRADPVGMLGPLVIGAIVVGAAGLIGGAIAAYNAPEGQKLSAFGKGAVVGAGAALVGVGLTLAFPAVAATVGGLAAIGAVEGAVGSALDDLVNGRPICWECMAASAGIGAVLGVLTLGVGGFLGRTVLKKLGPKLKPFLDKFLKRGGSEVAEEGAEKSAKEGTKDAAEKLSPQERLNQRREQQRIDNLRKKAQDAEARGKLDDLSPDEKKWLNEDPRRKELAYDPATDSFKPDEAAAALAAEQSGKLKAPVSRGSRPDGTEGGDDFFDGNGNPWDVKDASAGSEKIAEIAKPRPSGKPGENVIVDGSKLSPAERAALEQDISSKLPAGSGKVVVVP